MDGMMDLLLLSLAAAAAVVMMLMVAVVGVVAESKWETGGADSLAIPMEVTAEEDVAKVEVALVVLAGGNGEYYKSLTVGWNVSSWELATVLVGLLLGRRSKDGPFDEFTTDGDMKDAPYGAREGWTVGEWVGHLEGCDSTAGWKKCVGLYDGRTDWVGMEDTDGA